MTTADRDAPGASGRGAVNRAWNALGTTNALLFSIAGVAAYRIWFYVAVARFAGMRGDEVFYWRSARTLLRMAHLKDMGNLGYADAARDIVSRGWFLPGSSGMLTPARLFSDDPAVGRAWVGIVSFALLLVIVLQVGRMFSRQAAVFTLLVVGLLPYTTWFSFAFWGGHVGGLIMVLNLLWTVRLARRIRDGEDPPWSTYLLLGASIAVSVYIRPTTLGQTFPIAALLFLAYSSRDDFWPALWKSFSRWAAMFVVFMLLFAPWSIALMIRFDGPFFVVTSRPLAEIMRNASDEDIERVGSSFGAWYNEIQRLMEERNQGFYDVVTAERDARTSTLSTGERLAQVSRGMQRFYDLENQFLGWAIDSANENPDNDARPGSKERLKSRYLRISSWSWAALTFLVLYTLMRRWAFWQSEGWLGIVLRASMAMALFQPLNGGPHGRHISFLVPLFALSVALALENRINARPDPLPSIRWPRIERFAVNAFTMLIAGFLAFYFTS